MKEIILKQEENEQIRLAIDNKSVSIVKANELDENGEIHKNFSHEDYEISKISYIKYELNEHTFKSNSHILLIVLAVILIIVSISFYIYKNNTAGTIILVIALALIGGAAAIMTKKNTDLDYCLKAYESNSEELFSIDCLLNPEQVHEIITSIRENQQKGKSNQ